MEFDNEENPNPPSIIDEAGNPVIGGIVVEQMSDAEILQFNQNVRMALVKQLTKHSLPMDEEKGTLLLTALRDSDKQIKDKQKMELANQQAKSDEEIRDLLIAMRQQSDYLKAPATQTNPDYVVIFPEGFGSNVSLVEGQTEVRPAELDYDSIMSVNQEEEDSSGT